ncbi:MAG TPA: hypothetical protein PKC30_07760 [Saprospiraceae bacterium]|nr:hypothetical protein [Saprospiraceae bacterium]
MKDWIHLTVEDLELIVSNAPYSQFHQMLLAIRKNDLHKASLYEVVPGLVSDIIEKISQTDIVNNGSATIPEEPRNNWDIQVIDLAKSEISSEEGDLRVVMISQSDPAGKKVSEDAGIEIPAESDLDENPASSEEFYKDTGEDLEMDDEPEESPIETAEDDILSQDEEENDYNLDEDILLEAPIIGKTEDDISEIMETDYSEMIEEEKDEIFSDENEEVQKSRESEEMEESEESLNYENSVIFDANDFDAHPLEEITSAVDHEEALELIEGKNDWESDTEKDSLIIPAQGDKKEEQKKEKKKKKRKKKSESSQSANKSEDYLSDFSKWLLSRTVNELEDSTDELPVTKKAKKKTKKARKKKGKKTKTAKNISLAKDAGIISEPLADLLAQQGHIEEAVRMYKQLGLIFPEKSIYFAAKIEKIKI